MSLAALPLALALQLSARAMAADDLAVRLSFRAGPDLVIAGDAELDGDALTVRRAGGNGRRLYDDIVGPLLAAGWTAYDELLEPGERPGVSQHAVSVRFKHGNQALSLDLFDAGYGQESVAMLRVQYAGMTPGLVGPGVGLGLGGAFKLSRSEACQEAGDPAQVAAAWSSALLSEGWVAAPGGWLARGGRQVLLDAKMNEACAQLDIPLPERWAALGLPAQGGMVTGLGKASLQLRLADEAALQRWLVALDSTLVHAGWVQGPTTRAGTRSYSRPGDHLSVIFGSTEGASAYVGLTRAPHWSQPDLAISLVLPYGRLQLSGGMDTVGTQGVELWRRDESPDDGAQLLFAAAKTTLIALGWSQRPAEPDGRVVFSHGSDTLGLSSGSGLDPERQGSTALLRIDLAPKPLTAPGAKAPRASPAAPAAQPFSFVLTVPGGEIAVRATGAGAEEGALCLEHPDLTPVDMDGALHALGWRSLPQPSWYARDGKHARVRPADGSMCIVMDVPVDPAWAGIVDAASLVTACSEEACSLGYPEVSTAVAERDRAIAELTRRGWTQSAEPRDVVEDETHHYEERRYALGDEEITLGLLEAGEVTTLDLTRRGPPMPW